MLTHPTLDQLRTLKLDGMAQAFVEIEAQEQAHALAHAEWLALLLDREAANRNTRRFHTRLRAAPRGTMLLESPRSATRSWIALFTMPTGSNSMAPRCARSKPRPPRRQRNPPKRPHPMTSRPKE